MHSQESYNKLIHRNLLAAAPLLKPVIMALMPQKNFKLNMNIHYRFMNSGEETKVCALVEKVFIEFVAPDYGPKGIHEFLKLATPAALAKRFGRGEMIVVAESGPEIIGVIEVLKYRHISMLFVGIHGEGIGRELIRRAVEECRRKQADLKQITVNSSPFAELFYYKMGFKTTGPFQKKNGIIFMPMVHDLA